MNQHTQIYEQDIDAWIDQQVRLLKEGRLREIDVEHLIEELQDMGKSNRRELESRLIILIAHLLKWQYQREALSDQWKEFEGKGWRNTIIEQRVQLLFLLKKVPSLRSMIQDAIAEVYSDARRLAVRETGLKPNVFPEQCPYVSDLLLDEDYYPDNQ